MILSGKKSKMKNNIAINVSAQTPYLAKFWFLSYGPKSSRLVKLQDYLQCNIL